MRPRAPTRCLAASLTALSIAGCRAPESAPAKLSDSAIDADPALPDSADSANRPDSADTSDSAADPADTADTAGTGDSAAPEVDVAIPDWPSCPGRVDAYTLDDPADVVKAWMNTTPDLISLISGTSFAATGAEGDFPTITSAGDTRTFSGECVTSSGSTYTGTLSERSDGPNLAYEADAFAVNWVDADAGEFDFSADGSWSGTQSGGVTTLVGNGTWVIVNALLPADGGPVQGGRAEDGGYTCEGGLCFDAGYIDYLHLYDYNGEFNGDRCYAGATHGDVYPGEWGDGAVRIVAAHRYDLRFNPEGWWLSVDDGPWETIDP